MRQSASLLFMVRPKVFRANEETASDNKFQTENEHAVDLTDEAQTEFDGFVHVMEEKGIKVYVGHITDDLDTPDALFPNNWISFHENGVIALYPMKAENRRLEKREYLIEEIVNHMGLFLEEIVDFSEFEDHESYLEGTGSLVIDRQNEMVYAALSERTDEKAARIFCDEFAYQGILFETQLDGSPIYHTNVMMSIATDFVLICDDVIADDEERKLVIDSLSQSEREIIHLTIDQMRNFACNALEVYNEDGEKLLVMSKTGVDSLTATQVAAIQKYAEIVPVNIQTIERHGGGSARCMLCEVFLPKL